MKHPNKLARAFRAVAGQEKAMESTASSILTIIRGAKALTEPKFDKLVEAAYDANGWNSRPGRPSKDEAPKDSVPNTVRTYVAIIRRAMRLKLKVGTYKTFTSLRESLEAKLATVEGEAPTARRPTDGESDTAKILRLPAPVRDNFADVELRQPKALTGAVVHDVGVIYAHLPKKQQTELEKKLERLLNFYRSYVPQLSAPMVENKVAA